MFCVGEYWDSCNYNGQGLDYNQGMHYLCLSCTKRKVYFGGQSQLNSGLKCDDIYTFEKLHV